MFGFLRNVVVGLLSFSASLTSMVNIFNLTTSISLNNQLCMTRPSRVNLNPDEYNPKLCYYSFMVNLGRRNGSCNTLDDLSGKICCKQKKNVNLNVFHTITGINE